MDVGEGTLTMAGLRSIFRRWQLEHYEALRRRERENITNSRKVLGAYGLDAYPQVEPSDLNDSLLVAWLSADDPRRPA